MISRQKTVYYCDFCSKHGLSRSAMMKHERYCTLNPGRSCRWHLLDYGPRGGAGTHTFRRGLPRWVRLRSPLDKQDIEDLREKAMGCPACMLAALRQSGIEYHYTHDDGALWDYDEEVKRYREEEQEFWLQEERRDIEYGWL